MSHYGIHFYFSITSSLIQYLISGCILLDITVIDDIYTIIKDTEISLSNFESS